MAANKVDFDGFDDVGFFGHDMIDLVESQVEDGMHMPVVSSITLNRNKYGVYAIIAETYPTGFKKNVLLNLPSPGATLKSGEDANPLREGLVKRLLVSAGFPEDKANGLKGKKALRKALNWLLGKQVRVVYLGYDEEAGETLDDATTLHFTPEEWKELEAGDRPMPKRRRKRKRVEPDDVEDEGFGDDDDDDEEGFGDDEEEVEHKSPEDSGDEDEDDDEDDFFGDA